MTSVAVSTAVDALVMAGLAVRIVLGRRSELAALVAPHRTLAEAGQPGPAVVDVPVRRSGLDDHWLEEGDPVRVDDIRLDFMANVSHELKTPVGAVALLAEAVLDAADDPHQVRRFGNKILHEANRLGTLVTELIALSRLQTAERLPDLATIEADAVVRDALARCRLAVESADIQVTVDSSPGLRLTGDATLLVTALSNLIDNAVSYSPPGSPVSVNTRLAAGFVEIAVTDHGRGIEPEYQQRVFERFFRVDQALSRSTGGTGLGLAIVKRVAVNHGGDVQLRSQLRSGSTFTLRIPAHHHTSRTPSAPEYVATPTQ